VVDLAHRILLGTRWRTARCALQIPRRIVDRVGSTLALGLWIAAIVGSVAPLLIGRFLRPPTPAVVEADPD